MFVNLDPCTGGTCLAEMHWDSTHSRIVAVGMSINGGNTIAAIDPAAVNHTHAPGSVAISPLNATFGTECGVQVRREGAASAWRWQQALAVGVAVAVAVAVAVVCGAAGLQDTAATIAKHRTRTATARNP